MQWAATLEAKQQVQRIEETVAPELRVTTSLQLPEGLEDQAL
jgi:hypothetical protein